MVGKIKKLKIVIGILICLTLMVSIFLYSYNYYSDIYDSRNEIDIPILYYHDIKGHSSEVVGSAVTREQFFEVCSTLKLFGYETITFVDMYEYSLVGKRLPAKPIVITFDDGYDSNYEYAFQVLKELDMKATIFVIGSLMGSKKYKNTNFDIIPHFTLDAAKEMFDSGLVDIQSHTYNLHRHILYDNDYREGVLPKDNESEKDYASIIANDFSDFTRLIEPAVGNKVIAYAYPYGKSTGVTKEVLKNSGVTVTVTTAFGISKIIRGDTSSLFDIKRLAIENHYSADDVLSLIDKLILE